MPNHLTSVCTVTGLAELVEAFRARCIVSEEGKSRFAFETIVPVPPEVLGTESGSEADLGLYALGGDEPETQREIRERFGFPDAEEEEEGRETKDQPE